MPDRLNEQFVQQLIVHQDRLFAFTLSLLGDENEAEEVLQETNLALSRRAGEFAEVQDFMAWACRAAHFQVMALRKRKQRDRLCFDDDILDCLADEGPEHLTDADARQDALHDCLQQQSQEHRELVLRRYEPGGSVQQLADELGRPAGSVSQTLYRIRGQLLDCIQRKLASEEQA